MSEKKYKMTISYDGNNFSGWQTQKNAVSIQEIIERALKIILKKEIRIEGSGRTDAGVHALAQIAHFTSDPIADLTRFLYPLNGILPPEIRVHSVEEVPLDFHSRYSAVKKTYHYHLTTTPYQKPFQRGYRYHFKRPFDMDLLKKAASYFIGTHNFKAFSNKSDKGSASINPVRTIYAINIVEQEDGLRLEFEGDGFLYKMVRNIVGTLLDCAISKIPCEKIPEIFASLDRKLASDAAPPHGLFLVKVEYE